MNNRLMEPSEGLERIELLLLLEGIYQQYGYDFRNYSFQYIRRRVWNRIRCEGLQSIPSFQERVLREREMMDRLSVDFSINVTEMFRDPSFFLAFRQKIVPLLRSLPGIRIWHAGCSTGEEVYSMAILLFEEGLYEKSTIYGTDMSGNALDKASKGIFPIHKMQQYTKNYMQSGGKQAFSEYYSVQEKGVVFHPFLADNIEYFQHNLATDHSFNEFHIIICRNVLIYFNDVLQQRVLNLFRESLVPLGFLGLGNKEFIPNNLQNNVFIELDPQEKIYRKNAALLGRAIGTGRGLGRL